MTVSPNRMLFRSYTENGLFMEETIEVNVLTGEAKIVSLFHGETGRLKEFNADLSPEAKSWVDRQFSRLKKEYELEVERQGYWMIDWNNDTPLWVNSIHGSKTKQEAMDRELKVMNVNLGDVARNLNAWMQRLARTKESIKILKGLEV